MKKQDKPFDFSPAKLAIGLVTPLVLVSYLLLQPTPTQKAESISTAKEFAQFIQTRPEIAQRRRKSFRSHPPAPAPSPAIDSGGPLASLREITLVEHFEISNTLKEWQNPSLQRNHQWREQVHRLLEIAVQTRQPEILDLLRRELVRAKKDLDPINSRLFENWRVEYLKIDPRKASALELE